MKIAIIGARGQLGQDLCRTLAGDIVPLGRPDVDLTRPDTLKAVLSAERPDIVTNCAAYNFVDRAEDEPDAAFAVNATGVQTLATACRDAGCVLVHFSTDHVFGAESARRTPYSESNPPGPVSVYGQSKLAGERFVQALNPRHFVIRTCGLYGKHGQGGKGGNFVEAILKRARAGLPLRVVNDQECTPTATVDLAAAVAKLITVDAYGLYHITNAGSCTWFDFAQAILTETGPSAPLTPVSTAEYGAKASRPAYSVLDCSRYAGLGMPAMRSWRESLQEYLAAQAEPPSGGFPR